MSEPTKRDVLEIADYLGCNGEELWSEMSKLLLQQDKFARAEEIQEIFTMLWDEDGAPFQRDDPPKEILDRLEDYKK